MYGESSVPLPPLGFGSVYGDAIVPPPDGRLGPEIPPMLGIVGRKNVKSPQVSCVDPAPSKPVEQLLSAGPPGPPTSSPPLVLLPPPSTHNPRGSVKLTGLLVT